MSPRFIIYRKSGAYYFELIASHSERVLRSDEYATYSQCKSAVDAAKYHSIYSHRYEKINATGEQFYFLLKDENDKTIASSERFGSAASRDYTIAIVKREALNAVIKELAL